MPNLSSCRDRRCCPTRSLVTAGSDENTTFRTDASLDDLFMDGFTPRLTGGEPVEMHGLSAGGSIRWSITSNSPTPPSRGWFR